MAVLSADPRGIVSLLSMLQFYAQLFVKNLTEIIAAQALLKGKEANSNLGTDEFLLIYAGTGMVAGDCKLYGLKSALDKCESIRQQLEKRKTSVKCSDVQHWLEDLRERIESDFSREYFLQLSHSEAEQFQKPLKDWDAVVSRFRKVQSNVEESSKSFALGRYGAAVFHVLLVAEFGVIKVAELFNVQGDKPGWGSLKRLQEIKDRNWKDKSPLEQEHARFLEDLLPLAISIKDSWRHKISHVDNQLEWIDTDFSPQVAGEIISATRGFMRRLAADLPRPPAPHVKVDTPYGRH